MITWERKKGRWETRKIINFIGCVLPILPHNCLAKHELGLAGFWQYIKLKYLYIQLDYISYFFSSISSGP